MCEPVTATTAGMALAGGAGFGTGTAATLGTIATLGPMATTGAAAASGGSILGLSAGSMMGLSLGINALQTGLGFMSQNSQADQMEEYQRQQAEADRVAANNAFIMEQAQIQTDHIAAEEAESRDLQQTQIEAMQAEASARVASGEAGVAGLSVERLMHDFDRQHSRYKEGVRANREARSVNTGDRIRAAQNRRDGRLTSASLLETRPVNRPSFTGAAAGFAGQAFNTYSSLGINRQTGVNRFS